jgi:hypothetical protein
MRLTIAFSLILAVGILEKALGIDLDLDAKGENLVSWICLIGLLLATFEDIASIVRKAK